MTSSLRIALILTEFPPHFGGMQTHAVHLARALAARGHAVTVYTYRSNHAEEAAAAAAFDAGCGYRVQRTLSRIGFWFNHRWLAEALARQPVDLIYASNVFYGLLGQALGAPVVCRSVGNDVLRPWIVYPFQLGSGLCAWPRLESTLYRLFRRCNSPEWIEALLRNARQRLMQRSAAANTLVLANSEFTITALRQAGLPRQQTSLLVGGVDCCRFTPSQLDRDALRSAHGLPANALLLFTACRLVAKKGVDFLLQQMPAILARHPHALLLIAGDGREKCRCMALATALGVADAVHFLGRVEHDALTSYYWMSDLFVLASRVTRNRISGLLDAETMGRVLCEANASGVPVLASRSGGIPCVIRHGENGLLFEEDDASSFHQQLEQLTGDAALRQQLVQTGLARAAREFDWHHIIAAHEAAFAAALAPHPQQYSRLALQAASLAR
ncbi:GDP-mannose-dependent monoacylated alpha-(1-6)-phosphatidylinositol monomannoside mannosyltransferase [Andreprevotia sp. IGB-42]|uniref:glycosyltransferase family 4 protein n=1 Tax=Andreprevotia sp. IGB-42 TaxID=2497473 RepID=UPI00135C1EC3|nr:glycosyltransferase family 4 protein [Andreprevotia sp. IGB-42]KAF0815052.1 GDP-mannose-dependent monoacylated alpha-(1-6)-phosphatidylinositol monomannoside mannosyltransferase [Andreprevotia sp. IGB-42]